MNKKIISMMLAFIFIFSSLQGAYAQATADPYEDLFSEVEQNLYLEDDLDLEEILLEDDLDLNYDNMTQEEKRIYDEVIAEDIKKYELEDPNFNKNRFLLEVDTVVTEMNSFVSASQDFDEQFPGHNHTGMLPPIMTSRAPGNFYLSNRAVGTAINIVISLLVGAASTIAIRAYIVKKGTTAATRILTRKVVSKLLALGIKEFSGLGTLMRSIIKFTDPGLYIAKWLDRRDYMSNNGRVDVRV